MSARNTRLTQFMADLHRCPADGPLKETLRDSPEQALTQYGLDEWHRELLFTLDRRKIAEAVYWELVAADPYEDERKEPHILWANPRRAIDSVSDSIEIGTNAKLEVKASGLRPTTRFVLLAFGAKIGIPSSSQPIYSGNLDAEIWTVTFDTSGQAVGQYLQLQADDGSGGLVGPHAIKVVAPNKP